MAGAEVILSYDSTIRKLLVAQPRIPCSYVGSRVIIREILKGNTQSNHFLENIEGKTPKGLTERYSFVNFKSIRFYVE